MRFESITPNPDLSIHEDPPGLWQHVAVICLWKDAKAQRQQWPHAAVIGPLRSLRGFDELARNLLHNPQIRAVLVVGHDQSVGGEVTAALDTLWKGGGPAGERYIAEEVRGPFWDVQVTVQLVLPTSPDVPRWRATALNVDLDPGVALVPLAGPDFAGGEVRPKVTLPPPPPKSTASGPPGDPGERVVGDTLAELWPQVLHRALRFGAVRPTQYGDTRELLCLVGVVRDVEKSIGDLVAPGVGLAVLNKALRDGNPIGGESAESLGVDVPTVDWRTVKHPILGISYNEVEAYRDRASTDVLLEGVPYSYGSRMRGLGALVPDQIATAEKLLAEKPDTRAAYATPWRAAEDAGKESGRPCMVGVWWRVVDDGEDKSSAKRLELVVAFRSWDLYAAAPTNLAGILLWQVETARKLGMRPGSLTVTSYSAHVYARDWNDAEVVVQEHYEKARREPQWDQRSSWFVKLIPPVIEEKPVEVGEVLQVPRSASGVLDTWEVQAEPVVDLYDHIWIQNQTTGERRKVPSRDWREKRGDFRGPQPKPTLRAVALSPDGRETLATFEAETPEGLRAMCERSGLITSIGSALWLGDEIRKIAGRDA